MTMLGVLKAGKFYVSIDPSFPDARISHLINDSRASVIVTNRQDLNVPNQFRKSGGLLLNADNIDDKVSDEME